MKNLNHEERSALSAATPTARKWLVYQFNSGKSLEQLYSKLQSIIWAERSVEQKWKEYTLKEMERQGLAVKTKVLYDAFAAPHSNLQKTLATAQKQYARTGDKHTARFISIINHLLEQTRTFSKEAYQMLLDNVPVAKILDYAQSKESDNDIANENKLYLRQTIKHIKRLKKNHIPVRKSILNIALNPEYSYDQFIFEKQVEIVVDTYDKKNRSIQPAIKDLCFEFIRKSIQVTGYSHPNLIMYLFYGNWISPETFQLLKELYPLIKKNSMLCLVYTPLNKLAATIRQKPVAEWSDSDQNIIELEQMYSGQ